MNFTRCAAHGSLILLTINYYFLDGNNKFNYILHKGSRDVSVNSVQCYVVMQEWSTVVIVKIRLLLFLVPTCNNISIT